MMSYVSSLHTVAASYPRQAGSTLVDERLLLCYRKYVAAIAPSKGNLVVNFVFIHGTGMNKGLWHYHIDKMYREAPFTVGTVLAPDMVNHGQSAGVNRDNLGYTFDWVDGAYDIVLMLKKESLQTAGCRNLNILVGHSMGGFLAMYTEYLNPGLFHAVVPINPIVFTSEKSALRSIEVFKGWLKRGYMQDTWPVGPQIAPRQVAEAYFKQESFFKRFHSLVLHHMLEDEWYEAGQPTGDVLHTYVKTTVANQMVTYLSSLESLKRGMKIFGKVNIPVYHVSSDRDTVIPQAIEFFRETTKKVLHPVDCKGFHLVNAEDPDLICLILQLVVHERTPDADMTAGVAVAEPNFSELERRRRHDLLKKKFEAKFSLKL